MTRSTPLLATLTLLASALSAQPNILFILADDMGYGDVGALNPNSSIPTVHLDRLAREGMTFSDAHSPSAVCTPTRYGIVTGRYCWRSRLKRGVLNGYGTPLIEADRLTVASFLRDQGYRTGIVGKWHLGLGFAKEGKKFDFSKPVSNGPHTHGFDFSHVIPASLDFPPYLYVRNGTITEFPTIEQSAKKFPGFLRKGERAPDLTIENCLDDLAREAAAFIDRESRTEQPFFLYLPLTAPHKPVSPHRRFVGKTKLGPYGDFVVQVDATVGKVLAALDKADLADKTLVIYTSDNGSFMYRQEGGDDHVTDNTIQAYSPGNHTANGELRGTKADIWEAGHRVPFFARWPTKIQAGTVTDTTICLTDFFATAAELIGADIPEGAAPDSYSFSHLMLGQEMHRIRPPVINHSIAGMFAIRRGAWKLVLGNGSGGRQPPRGKAFAKPYQLFDLSQDLAEQNNLIESQAEIAAELEAAFEKIR